MRLRKKIRISKAAQLALLFFVVLCSCSKKPPSEEASFSLTDDLQRNVEFSSPPMRIVSLTPSFTEILYALDADTLLVGVSNYCNYPSEASSKPSIGSILDPSIEAITALQPDLIFMTAEGNLKTTFQQLERLGLKTFISNPTSLESVFRAIKQIATITGRLERANVLIDSLHGISNEKPKDAEEQKRKPVILMTLSTQPLIAAGNDTFLNELILLAGGQNAVAIESERYPVISRELVINQNPDIILFPNDMNITIDMLLDTFPEWNGVKAIQHGELHIVEADIFLRPSPRLWMGLEHLREIIGVWDKKRRQ